MTRQCPFDPFGPIDHPGHLHAFWPQADLFLNVSSAARFKSTLRRECSHMDVRSTSTRRSHDGSTERPRDQHRLRSVQKHPRRRSADHVHSSTERSQASSSVKSYGRSAEATAEGSSSSRSGSSGEGHRSRDRRRRSAATASDRHAPHSLPAPPPAAPARSDSHTPRKRTHHRKGQSRQRSASSTRHAETARAGARPLGQHLSVPDSPSGHSSRSSHGSRSSHSSDNEQWPPDIVSQFTEVEQDYYDTKKGMVRDSRVFNPAADRTVVAVVD